MIDWDRAFVNTNVNEQVFILSKTILNILSTIIPHETLTIYDEVSDCFTKENLIQEKNNIYKSYQNSKSNAILEETETYPSFQAKLLFSNNI